ncbi:MAG TPA: hypothetical protein VG621_02135 [Candidatus Paceibacterota bacterium]|nr:hypothetical protein [Candidatus Paceibacterota bacterium]
MKSFLILLIIAAIVCAWCPWLSMADAKQLIYNNVYSSQSTLQNGCVLTIDTTSLQKVLFGYKENVGYQCTYNTDFITEGSNTVFVSFFKQVFNVPHPIIK